MAPIRTFIALFFMTVPFAEELPAEGAGKALGLCC
jgi:hypothetical protein